MSSCNVRSADEGSLTRQISLTQLCSQELSKSVGCWKVKQKAIIVQFFPVTFVNTNLSLLDLYFSKKVRMKKRMNNLPTVVSTAFSLLFSEQQHLEKMSTWQRRGACLIDQQAWGRGSGWEQESKSIKNNGVMKPVSWESSLGRRLGGGTRICFLVMAYLLV